MALNYGNFDQNKFNSFHSNFDNQIDTGQHLSQQDKVTLGRQLSKIEKNETGSFFESLTSKLSPQTSEAHLIDLADKYIDLKKNISQINLDRPDTKINEMIDKLKQNPGESESDLKEFIPQLYFEKKDLPESETKDPSNLATRTNDISQNVFEDKTPVTKEELLQVDSVRIKYLETPMSAMERLEGILHLNVVPDIPKSGVNGEGKPVYTEGETDLIAFYKQNNDDKKALIKAFTDPEKAHAIAEQCGKYPIMQAGIATLRENLVLWNDLSFRNDHVSLESLQKTIEQQLLNLSALSDILSELSQREGYSDALSGFSLDQCKLDGSKEDSEVNSTFTELVNSYLEGKVDLKVKEGREFMKEAIALSVDLLKQNSSAPKMTKELSELRKSAPVTAKSIQLQAELHQAIRRGKGWAADQPKLTIQGTSVNDVFKLKSPTDTKETAAFFKVGKGNEKAAGTMEKLMWDIAVVMGLEEQFVPTAETEVRAQKELTGGTEKVMQWDSKGELQEVQGAKPPRKGGIQIAQQGKLLNDHSDAIPREEIVKGTLGSIIFGLFDAHGGNIFVAEEKEAVENEMGQEEVKTNLRLKFFDNTRSLPNSNGFINRGNDRLVSSYRCALLDRPESKAPLTGEELAKLKNDVLDYKQKLEKLETYLNSTAGQAQINKLPPGWMDLNASLSAMEERIELMDAALDGGRVKTLEDLAIQSNPSYKLAYALTLFEIIHTEKTTKKVHTSIGYFPANETIDTMINMGIDLHWIKSKCDDPNVSLDDMKRQLKVHYKQVKARPPIGEVLLQRQANAQQIKSQLLSDAAADLKDKNRAYCEEQNFKLLKIPYATLPTLELKHFQNGFIHFYNQGKPYFILGQPGEWKFCYATPTGFCVKDFSQSPSGEIIIDGKKLRTLEDFNTYVLEKHNTTPIFDELPVLFPELRSDLAKATGLVMSKSDDGQDLVVTIRRRTGYSLLDTITLEFPSLGNGEFSYENEGYTIEEIVNSFKMEVQNPLIEKFSSDISAITNATEKANVEDLKRLGVNWMHVEKLDQSNLEKAIILAFENRLDPVLVGTGKPGEWKIIFSSPQGYRVNTVDLSQEGNIKVENELLKIEKHKHSGVELIKYLDGEQEKNPRFDIDIPVLSEEKCSYLATNTRAGIVFNKKDDDTLSVHFRAYDDEKKAPFVATLDFAKAGTFGRTVMFTVTEDHEIYDKNDNLLEGKKGTKSIYEALEPEVWHSKTFS